MQQPAAARRGTGETLTHAQRMRHSARPTGSGVRHVRHLDVLDRLAGPWSVNDLAIAGIQAHMTETAGVEEHQIA